MLCTSVAFLRPSLLFSVHCPGILCRLLRPFFIVHFALILATAPIVHLGRILAPVFVFSPSIVPAFYAGVTFVVCADYQSCIHFCKRMQ